MYAGLMGMMIVVAIQDWRREGFPKLETNKGFTPMVLPSTALVIVGVVPRGAVWNSSCASAFVILGL